MDDWVNAMSFDTTRRVGDLGILYTADRYDPFKGVKTQKVFAASGC